MTLHTKARVRRTGSPKIAGTRALHFGHALSASTGLAGEYWRLSLADSLDAPHLKDAVQSLTLSTHHPNPFYSLPILEPAIQHLGNAEVKFLCLTRHDPVSAALHFFLPVKIKKPALGGFRIMSGWTHEYGPLGTPLISSNEPDETFKALTHCLLLAQTDHADALVIDHLPKKSRVSSILFESPNLSDRLLRFAPTTRAGISSRASLDAAVSQVSGKRRQRLASAKRKLEKIGAVGFSTQTTVETIHRALKDQLQLENEGWKGRRGTAILNHDNVREFVTTSIGNLAKNGDCKIHALTLNGIPIASMIMIHSAGRFFPWKIAFDETYARFSVGNLLVSHVNEMLRNNPEFSSLDSLASELNDTANRFWGDGQEFSGMVIGFGSNAGKTALQIARSRHRNAKIKRVLKRLANCSL